MIIFKALAPDESSVALNPVVKQTIEVDVEVCGIHSVYWESLNLMDTLLVERVHGKLVPVSVKLSPPNKFIRFVGTT